MNKYFVELSIAKFKFQFKFKNQLLNWIVREKGYWIFFWIVYYWKKVILNNPLNWVSSCVSWCRKKGAHVIRVYIKQLCVFCHVIVCQSVQEIICALDLGLYSLAQMRSAKCLKQKISLIFCLVCLKLREKDEFDPLDVLFLNLLF